MQRILIIEDDESIVTGLVDNFKVEGYEVLTAGDGNTGLDLARKKQPELIILDLMLPDLSGYDVCRALKSEKNKAAIIMLTARGEEVDKILGLEMGADDYVTKPFSVRELLARVNAVLRRSGGDESGEGPEIYTFGSCKFDFKSYEAFKDGKLGDLTPREFEVMRYLIRHRGKVVSRFDLLDDVWGYDNYPTTRTVDNHIWRLRQFIEDDPANPVYIISIRGVGYKFAG
jgi:DNA-binding response OmpR family regulator